MKECSVCKTTKPLISFSRKSISSEERRSSCKDCCRSKTKKWRQDHKDVAIKHSVKWQNSNKERVKLTSQKYLLKKKFGLSIEEYNKKLDQQNGLCALCNKECKSGRNLAVDHNHKTGKIRGLLCGNCNMGLGSFYEDKNLLSLAIKYLSNYEKA